MSFDVEICHVIRFGGSKYRLVMQYELGDEVILTADKENNLGHRSGHKQRRQPRGSYKSNY